ncbi:carbohydrate kinase family protein [Marinitenerispora sediminis]|uniref:carbohydrate kinase family protein n=1 Tax=Marinitenerispora sediminis TaxID=1931232 RepID=UPI000DF36EF0|nr:carbohydrate kinase [Marinitenerispora sediminis]RCV54089.1 carbohydrate kinase [Marinitenerispora sediminis]RCV56812.1 carbohydrate kinase [Marinitenerispora sediminis]
MTAGALVVGEALIDVVRRPGAPTRRHPGGSGANAALGLARLGRPTRFLTRWGQDSDGELLHRHLSASGVLLPDRVADDLPTPRAEAVLDENGSATYEFTLDWRLPAVTVDPAVRVLHTGSIAAVYQPGGEQVLDLMRRAAAHATITYDPNVRPTVMGDREDVRRRVAERVAASDVVKVSEEDLGWLEPDTAPEAAARSWLAAGPSLVVLTRGEHGAVAFAPGATLALAAVPADVADTVGAGDAFMAALIDGLWTLGLLGAGRRARLRSLSADGLSALLAHAGRAAAIAVARPGADPPTRAELPEMAEPGAAA